MKLSQPPQNWVILPGLLCDSRMFEAQLQRLPNAVCIDGFYGAANRIEAMADYALTRMPERANLLGHSMGARVAFEIMRRAPDRVGRLVLADTGIHSVRPGEKEKRLALRDIGRADGMEALVDAWLPPMIGPQRRNDAALWPMLRSMSVSAGIEVYEAQIEAMLNRPVVDDLLPAIRTPALAIVGADDEWSPPAQHEYIAARIPGAALRILPDAGHMAPAERPDQFTDMLCEWANTVTATV